MWQGFGYSGVFWFRNMATNNQDQWYYVGNSFDTNSSFNDQASSLYCNRARSSCLVSKDWPPSNNMYCIPAQWVSSDLRSYVWQDGSTMNRSISSFVLQSYAGCLG
jgi:hypothetical protein